MGAVRGALLTLIAAACLTAGTIAVAQEPPPGEPPDRRPMDDNPCLTERAKTLLCPDLVMRRPYGLYTERLTKPGHTVLRAGNVIDSVGKGPAELHGTRIGPRFMKGRQRIYKRGGGKIGITTGARLQFKFAHQQLYWWKFYDAARFELWRLDPEGRRTSLVRTGPKVAYCLRDLGRTRPGLRGSPPGPVYPACSTNSSAQRVTLGTSVGWADIYPPAYPEQWIDVTGLRGCFAYAHIADPENGIYESDEDNNEAQIIVRLPFEQGNARRGCKGRDRGRPYGPRTPY
jgi:Lysyl oxidase